MDREFGDNQNTIGDNSKIYGNLNQGNQDFSVNISSQFAGGGEQTTSNSGLTNMQSAEAYKALNENQYERSKAKFNAQGYVAGVVDSAKESTGVDNYVNAVNTSVSEMSNYYGDKASNYRRGMFGDRGGNYTPPKWNPPTPPDPIETKYDKDKDDDE